MSDHCPGSGRRWGGGTGLPICPACHRGPRGLGMLAMPKRRLGKWAGLIPVHPKRAA